MILKTWRESDFSFAFKELKTKPCSVRDLYTKEGETQTSYGFFPPSSGATILSEKDAAKYKCIDEPFEIYGNYNSQNFANLIITFELCSLEKRDTCKSDKEISEAIEFSYIVVVENEQIYKHDEFPGSENYIENFSHIKWYPVSKELS